MVTSKTGIEMARYARTVGEADRPTHRTVVLANGERWTREDNNRWYLVR